MDEIIYKPKDFGRMINRSVLTLQRWDRQGILPAHRSPTNRRYYTRQQYLDYLAGKFNQAESTLNVSKKAEQD